MPWNAAATAPSKGQGMQLVKNQRINQFLQSLKAEGEEITEDVQPSLIKSRATAPPPSNPVSLIVDEKLCVTLKSDGGLANFDVQGFLSLQILDEKDAYLHVQVRPLKQYLHLDSSWFSIGRGESDPHVQGRSSFK